MLKVSKNKKCCSSEVVIDTRYDSEENKRCLKKCQLMDIFGSFFEDKVIDDNTDLLVSIRTTEEQPEKIENFESFRNYELKLLKTVIKVEHINSLKILLDAVEKYIKNKSDIYSISELEDFYKLRLAYEFFILSKERTAIDDNSDKNL